MTTQVYCVKISSDMITKVFEQGDHDYTLVDGLPKGLTFYGGDLMDEHGLIPMYYISDADDPSLVVQEDLEAAITTKAVMLNKIQPPSNPNQPTTNQRYDYAMGIFGD